MSDDIEHRAFWEEAERPFITGVTIQEAAAIFDEIGKAMWFVNDLTNLNDTFGED